LFIYQINEVPKWMLEIDLKRKLKAIAHYGERISQAERSDEFALSETLRNIIVQKQNHDIELKYVLELP
jgi:bacterioferritin